MNRLALGLAIALLPAVAAIWVSPCFVTQDGPAHLYNAHVLRRSFDPASPYRSTYAVRWQPLPNWAGHLLYLALDATLPPQTAERVAATLTLIALAAATAWLRHRVDGSREVVASSALAAMIGLNVTWLFGFTSFLLGAATFAVTLGVWWAGRERITWMRTIALAALVVLGYFCHPVSLWLTAFALVVLAALAPGEDRRRRLIRTLLGLSPLVPLGLLYKGLTRAGGAMRPEWGVLKNPLSLGSLKEQFGWVDPITIAAKVYRPFGETPSPLNGLFAPVTWLVLSIVGLTAATLLGRDRDRPGVRGWGVLAALLVFGSLVTPDTLGVNHGHYLPQRVVLLGLVALAAWLRHDAPGPLARLGRAGLVVALVVQSLFVWDYGRESTRTAGRLLDAGDAVGTGRREATVLLNILGRFRSNPLLHADCLLGVDTDDVIWADYETNYYYFPVQLRDPGAMPRAAPLEIIARTDTPGDEAKRAGFWSDYLDRHAQAIDVVVIYGTDQAIDAVTARRFERSRPGGGRTGAGLDEAAAAVTALRLRAEADDRRLRRVEVTRRGVADGGGADGFEPGLVRHRVAPAQLADQALKLDVGPDLRPRHAGRQGEGIDVEEAEHLDRPGPRWHDLKDRRRPRPRERADAVEDPGLQRSDIGPGPDVGVDEDEPIGVVLDHREVRQPGDVRVGEESLRQDQGRDRQRRVVRVGRRRGGPGDQEMPGAEVPRRGDPAGLEGQGRLRPEVGGPGD